MAFDLTRHRFEFQAEDPQLSDAVLVSFYRHMWFLTEEMVVLALCDPGVSDDVKSRMVTSMLAAGRPQQFLPGKPRFKPELLQGRPPDAPQLFEFVGERSWLIFFLMDLDVAWMQLPPERWDEEADYRKFKVYVVNLAVVNDAAERAVKVVDDFANHTHDDFAHLTKEELANI